MDVVDNNSTAIDQSADSELQVVNYSSIDSSTGLAKTPSAPPLKHTTFVSDDTSAQSNANPRSSRANSYGSTSAESTIDATQLYLKEIGYTPLLSAEEEVYYARRALQGDDSSRKRMIESNLRLVVKIARRYINRGLTLLDLVEEGNLGLIHAVEKFDPEKGFRFSTYATWWIRQNIERGLMNQTRTIRLPVHVVKELNVYLRAERELINKTSRDPSYEDIAALVDKPVEDVKRVMSYNERVNSADAPLANDAEKTVVETLTDTQPDTPEGNFENNELHNCITRWLCELNEKQRDVIARRFGLLGHDSDTLENVGREVGLTRERVRQIQIDGLKRLKLIMGREGVAKEVLAQFMA